MSNVNGIGWYAGYVPDAASAGVTTTASTSSTVASFTDHLASAVKQAVSGAGTGTEIETHVTAPGQGAVTASAMPSVAQTTSSIAVPPPQNVFISATTPMGMSVSVPTLDSYFADQTADAQNNLLSNPSVYGGQTEQEIENGLLQSAQSYLAAYPQAANGQDPTALAATYGSQIYTDSQNAQAASLIPRSDPAFLLLPGQLQGSNTVNAALLLYQQEQQSSAA